MKAPFPWFGGKSKVANIVWDHFGNIGNYVEPFFGSGAVLLQRPHQPKNETVNDIDAFLSNFWRAIAADPEALAFNADRPVNETDLHAVHIWLVNQHGRLRELLTEDPDYFDVRIAGRWVWGISQWIGSGWCVHSNWKKRPNLRRGGLGVHGIPATRLPAIGGSRGASGRGVSSVYCSDLVGYMQALRDRLRRVRVCCGDWTRVLGPCVTTNIGLTGVFLDPPYGGNRDEVYANDSKLVAGEVAAWALENGDNPLMRIALCGYEGEHTFPDSWTCYAWKANGGYGNMVLGSNGRKNAGRERIWFSPHCIEAPLFSAEQVA